MPNAILRFFAVLILIAVVITLPFSLLLRDLGALIFDPETTKSLVKETLLDEDFMAGLASRAVQGMLASEAESDDPASIVLQKGLEQMQEQDWAALTQLVAPPELIAETSNTLIDAYAEWLNGGALLPELQLDLSAWKRNLRANAPKVVAVVLDSLPDCSLEQLSALLGEGVGEEGLVGLIPACKPPEPLYSTLLNNADRLVSGFTSRTPDQLDLTDVEVQETEQLLALKENLNRSRLILTWAWLPIISVGALAVFMAARSLPAALNWAGWPLLLAGGITLAFGRGLALFSSSWLDRLLDALFEDAPSLVGALLGTAAGSVLELVSRPLSLQGGLLSLLGLSSLVYARVLANRAAAEPIQEPGSPQSPSDPPVR